MMRGASGDDCGNLLGQECNRPARGRSVEKAPGSDFLPLLSLRAFVAYERVKPTYFGIELYIFHSDLASKQSA
jgi:hypothetical protein